MQQWIWKSCFVEVVCLQNLVGEVARITLFDWSLNEIVYIGEDAIASQ